MTPTLIALVGGSGAGKTTFARHLQQLLGTAECAMLSADNYYRSDAGKNGDYDELRDFDHAILARHLTKLRAGVSVFAPRYDFAAHHRAHEHVRVDPRPFVIVEGLYLLADERLRDLFDFKIFIDVDQDVRLARRLLRDNVWEKRLGNEPLEEQIVRYLDYVKPKYDEMISPAMRHADLVVPNNHDMESALAAFEARIRASRLLRKVSV